MENDSSAVEGLAKVEPFSWCGVLAEVGVHGQVWCSSEAEAEHGACEVEPEESVVGFGESEGSVGLAKSADDGVWGCGFIGVERHCGVRFFGLPRDTRMGRLRCEC